MVTDWWYFLGVTLGLRPDVLERIECDGRNMQRNMTLKWCQCKMILKWLDTGLASWSSLVKALKSPIINKNEVAEQIIKDHPKKCCMLYDYTNCQFITIMHSIAYTLKELVLVSDFKSMHECKLDASLYYHCRKKNNCLFQPVTWLHDVLYIYHVMSP